VLRDDGGVTLGHKPEPHRGLSDTDPHDSPDGYEEFVSRQVTWWAALLSIALPLYVLLRAGGAHVWSYIVPALSVVAAIVQYVTQKPVRLVLAEHGLFYQHGSTRRVIYWNDVREIVIDKASKRLELHVPDERPLMIGLKSFPDSGRLKEMVLSYLPQEVRVIERGAVGSPLFPAAIVWVFSGFAVLVVAFSPEAWALLYVVLGIGIGAIAGVAYVRFVRPTRKARFWTNLGCLFFLLVAIAFGIWLIASDPKLRSVDVVIAVLCVVVGLASAFALVVAAVRAPEIKARETPHA